MARLKNLAATVTLDLPHEVNQEAFVLYLADAIENYGRHAEDDGNTVPLSDPPSVRKVKFGGETFDLQDEE